MLSLSATYQRDGFDRIARADHMRGMRGARHDFSVDFHCYQSATDLGQSQELFDRRSYWHVQRLAIELDSKLTHNTNLFVKGRVKRAVAGSEVHILGKGTRFGCTELAVHAAVFPLDAQRPLIADHI